MSPSPPAAGLYATLCEDMSVLDGVGSGVMAMVKCILGRPGFLAVFLHRLAANCAHKNKLGQIGARFFARLNFLLNACDISPQAVIGPGFKLSHPMGIVIGPATVGRNVMMLQNTTLGMRRFTDNERDPACYPTVGDNVTICAGAVIAGQVTIGDCAVIGANAVVTQDVPAKATAVGIPARIVQHART